MTGMPDIPNISLVFLGSLCLGCNLPSFSVWIGIGARLSFFCLWLVFGLSPWCLWLCPPIRLLVLRASPWQASGGRHVSLRRAPGKLRARFQRASAEPGRSDRSRARRAGPRQAGARRPERIPAGAEPAEAGGAEPRGAWRSTAAEPSGRQGQVRRQVWRQVRRQVWRQGQARGQARRQVRRQGQVQRQVRRQVQRHV